MDLALTALADLVFEHPRLAAVYDAFDADRSDLDVYVSIAAELRARRVGYWILRNRCVCGHVAARSLEVTEVDPAKASLDVARAKPGAKRVRWIHCDATALPKLQVDLRNHDRGMWAKPSLRSRTGTEHRASRKRNIRRGTTRPRYRFHRANQATPTRGESPIIHPSQNGIAVGAAT